MRWLAILILVPLLLPATVAAQAPSGPTPVVGQPSISLPQVQTILAHSPLLAIAPEIYALGQQANIDPAFALAIWTHESSLDTAGASVPHNNPGNVICPAAAHPPALPCVAGDRWAQYPDLTSAVADWYRYINARYVQQGMTTVEAILPLYAPATDGNDVPAYIQHVLTLMRQWGSTTVGTGSGTPPQPSWAGGIIDSWVNAPLDAIQFRAIRSVAVSIWTALRSGFAVVLLLERLRRLLLASGFQPVIAAVATEVSGVLPSLMTLAAGLAALSFILRPVGRLRLSDLRTVIALCLLLPIGLPLASAGFQQLEGLRSDMAGALYDRAWQVTNAQGLLQGAATGGTLDQIGQVGPLDPAEGTARHGVDVAAAYVYAVASDILTPTHDLPVAFAAVYFPHPDTQLQGEAPTQRANDLHLAWMGVTRLAYGIGPVVFAFFESLTNLLWTLAGGFLFLAGVLSVAVCWFPPAQHIVYGVARKAFEVIVTSWGASILQAVLMAFVFALAGAQSATLLLGACIVGLFLALVFCWIAATTFYAALGGVVTAVTAGGVRAQELERGAAQARQQLIDRTQAVGGTLADAYAGTHDGKHAAGEALKAYRVASKNGPLYGATYAVPALAQLGALARLMHPNAAVSPALDRAAYTRSTAGSADPLAPRALHAIDRDHAALTKTKHEATDAITDPVERTARGLPPLQSAVPSTHPPSAGSGSADGAGGGVPGQSA